MQEDLHTAAKLCKHLYHRFDEGLLLSLQREMDVAFILARLEDVGIGIDLNYLQSKRDFLQKRLDTLSAEAEALVGHPINLASPQQLSKALYHELALPKGIGRSTGLIKKKEAKQHCTTNEATLIELSKLHPLPMKIIAFRQTLKVKSTWVDGLISKAVVHKDGSARIHSTWNATNTATGRLSSSDPNLQNLPRHALQGTSPKEEEEKSGMEENSFTVMVRDAFISSPGHSLVSADYSQIELRLAAHLAADKHLLNILLRAGVDGDTFRLIGARYLKKYPGAVTDEERQLAKRLCYGILYGQGNQALAATLKVGPDEVQNVIRAFMACFPDVRRFVEATKAKARSCGYIKTLYGRQRPLPDINSWDPEKRAQAERQAINTPIQGSAADIVKQAMIATKELESFQGGRTRLLMEIHDELVFEVPDVLVPSFGKRVQEVMQTAAGLDVPLPVNVRVGTRLGSLRPLTLP